MEDLKKQPEIAVEIDDVIAQGAHINLAMIGHSENEFILDFIFAQPQNKKAKVRSRVITSPAHAKMLVAALNDNIAKYEARFGEIKAQNQQLGEKKIGFYN